MILTEPQNHIIQNIQLIRKDYDLLGSYRLYHSNILEEGLKQPEQVKLLLFENLKSIEIQSKRNEIGYKNSDLIQTLK